MAVRPAPAPAPLPLLPAAQSKGKRQRLRLFLPPSLPACDDGAVPAATGAGVVGAGAALLATRKQGWVRRGLALARLPTLAVAGTAVALYPQVCSPRVHSCSVLPARPALRHTR